MILISLMTIEKKNFYAFLIRKEKTKYCANLHIKDVPGNKKNWKALKPCFSDMPKISERIFLIQMTKW